MTLTASEALPVIASVEPRSTVPHAFHSEAPFSSAKAMSSSASARAAGYSRQQIWVIDTQNPAKPILGAEASATVRHQLVGELKAIASSDDAVIWAHRILGAKNSLTEADARQVEDAFRAKLAALESAAGTSVANISDQPVSHAVSAARAIIVLARAAAGGPCPHGRRQTAFPLQCHPSWSHGGDGDRCAGGRRRLQSVRSGHHYGLRCSERELVLRLASLLWRLRRTTTMELACLNFRLTI
jgi:hypothetical protein